MSISCNFNNQFLFLYCHGGSGYENKKVDLLIQRLFLPQSNSVAAGGGGRRLGEDEDGDCDDSVLLGFMSTYTNQTSTSFTRLVYYHYQKNYTKTQQEEPIKLKQVFSIVLLFFYLLFKGLSITDGGGLGSCEFSLGVSMLWVFCYQDTNPLLPTVLIVSQNNFDDALFNFNLCDILVIFMYFMQSTGF